MTIQLFLGLDLGGSGAKASVFDQNGTQKGFGRASYTPVSPAAGQAQTPIEEIQAAARQAIRQATATCSVPIKAMAVSSQGQTFVALDKDDKPLHPAIMWYDSRSAKQAEELTAKFAKDNVGAPPVPIISTVAKIHWLRAHYPEQMDKACRYLLLPDYFAYHLTGKAVIDHHTAASTGLYSGQIDDFNPSALSTAKIAKEQLAEVSLPGKVIAPILPEKAKDWGLSPETLLVVGTNDQYAGALGAGNYRPGIVTVTLGTCLALVSLVSSSKAMKLPPGLRDGPFPIPNTRYRLAYVKTAGVLLDWFRRELADDMSFDELNKIAQSVPPGARGLTVCPHFDGRVSPTPDAAMRGSFLNLTLQHTRADFFRGILESLAFCLRENLEVLKQHITPDTVRIMGGGATNDFWLQMQADVIGMPVERPLMMEAAAFGAAMLAMAGSDPNVKLADISHNLYRAEKIFTPDNTPKAAYQAAYERYLEAVNTDH